MSEQAAFTAALRDPERSVPAGLTDPAGRPAGKRFDVYRNNVAVSLTEALETGFPVLRKLVGAEFFKGLAGIYLRTHPPTSPVLQDYGQNMPAFLRGFPPTRDLPYLACIARMELAVRRAYHAADAVPFDPATLGALSPADLNAAGFAFAPATQVVRSHYPIHGIWRRNTEPDAPKPGTGPENVLITRPGFDPIVSRLDAAQAVFVLGLMDGQSLSQALLRVAAMDAPFDLGDTLALLFRAHAFTSLKDRKTSP